MPSPGFLASIVPALFLAFAIYPASNGSIAIFGHGNLCRDPEPHLHHKISDLISFAKYGHPSLRRLRGGMDKRERRPTFAGLDESENGGKLSEKCK